MSRGVDRHAIFFDTDDRCRFGELLGATTDRFGLEVHAYCLMTNHFHLLVRSSDRRLSDGLQWLLSMYATHVNQRMERVGHLFGGRFTSRLITEMGYLANVVRYIHLNPLDIVGIELPSEYRWSSHRTYLRKRAAPRWMSTETVSTWFSNPAEFDRFVCAPILEAPSPPSIRLPDGHDLVTTVDLVLSERSDVRARPLMAQRRAVAITLAASATESSRRGVFDALGCDTTGARRTAVHRARTLHRTDPRIAELVEQVRRLYLADSFVFDAPAA
ncbi:transposase [Ilumatobacter sp.]|uniref:transposase n=1 Tax=Ilumatobacter sp. TaxID=1967498 RepID=UPI003C6FB79F